MLFRSYDNIVSDTGVGQGVPAERESEPLQGDVRNTVRLDAGSCSLPQTRSIWTELGKQIRCVLSSSFLLLCCFLLLACDYNCSIHFDYWLLYYPLLHTSSCYWCEFSSNSQQLAPTVGQGSKVKSSTMGLKWDIEKFTGDNDFGL